MVLEIAFLGASTGCGLSALRYSLKAGHNCIALQRTPSKLEAAFDGKVPDNLTIVEGNAHDVEKVKTILVSTKDPKKLVDKVISTIGGVFILSRLTIDDPNVCEKGVKTLLDSIHELKKSGVTGDPTVVALSSTGISKYGRDYPFAMIPLYKLLLVAHRDKKILEETLAGSDVEWVVIRASLLVDGATDKEIRVGVEDPIKGVEKKAVGYTISREDVGKWIFENLVEKENYSRKIVSVTY